MNRTTKRSKFRQTSLRVRAPELAAPGGEADPMRHVARLLNVDTGTGAILDCGHRVRLPKSIEHAEGVGVRCRECR